MYFEIPCQSLGYVRPTMCLAPKTYLRRTLSYLHCILWIWATLLWRPCSPRLSPCPSIYTKPHFRRQCTACGPIPELETAMRKQNRANSWAVAHDCGHHTSLKKQITSRSFFPLHHAPHTFLRLSFGCLQCSIGCFRYVSWLIPSFQAIFTKASHLV